MSNRTWVVLASLFALAACSWGTSPAAGTPSATARGPVRSTYNLITAEQLAAAGDATVYDVIMRYRPRFLQSHEPPSLSHSPTPVQVYVNDTRFDAQEALTTIRASTVKEVRFVEPPEANNRWGTGHNGGVILVTLR